MLEIEENTIFESLLNYLKHNRGIDFTGYKRSTLVRRVTKRMQEVGIQGYSNYQDYLEVHPDEFIHLFNILLINVTAFFRDRCTWDYLASEILPQIITSKDQQEPIRIWSAGCASGEEPYTLAIALAEILGIEQFRARVKIYATDIDEEALSQARAASYSEKDIETLSEEFINKYFSVLQNRYIFHKGLRSCVIFGRHDLVQHAPISRIDLLVCRNTLMYFNSETQGKILKRFHFALNDNAFLVLGKAETLLSLSHSFSPIDLKRRIFMKVNQMNLRDRMGLLAQVEPNEVINYSSSQVRLREAAFDVCPLAQLVIDFNGSVILANERTRSLFGLSQTDIGRPLQDLEISYRPLELRSCIQQVYAERRTITIKDIHYTPIKGIRSYLEVQIIPLMQANGNLLGAHINFWEVSDYKQLQEELQNSTQELEMAYEELQSMNEELETTNEELQCSVEELETTNEELQSTNEELETINDELQSTNEELQSMNTQLRHRTDQVNEANNFLASILTSIQSGVVVLSENLQVQIWNQAAEKMWGLRSHEAEKEYFLNLDIGLPVEQLKHLLKLCLNGEFNLEGLRLEATNRRGKKIFCNVSCTPLLNSEGNIKGVILFMEEVGSEEPLSENA